MRLIPKKLIFILTMSFVPFILSGESILEYLEGDVLVIRNGEELDGDFGMELDQGDVILTQKESLAILELEGGRVLKMRENSSLRLENLSRNTSLVLQKGSVFSRVDHIINGKFEIRTESVVAGVRGTEFFVSFGKSVDDAADIWLCVNDGTVEVMIPETGDSILVNEGEGINILGGRALTAPEAYEWTKDLNWNTDPDAGNVKDETDLDLQQSVYRGRRAL
ncbi:FecR family protein [Oceanispirochaeta sp.]|jgi:hypothetical protein|uniref:FecR family protein n=1 Tax=Oceanispirochaeta sp. TaxID=2035350 RepID=UPI00261DA808|nr:FecR family protein [Oceanispirochaeta sp.]MDA3957044.1 FecR family protein [Oceanispirochaeta sp.]